MNKIIYLDNAKTTMVDPRVMDIVNKYSLKFYGIPSPIEYGEAFGMKIKRDVEAAKEKIAKSINAEPEEIIFTSGEIENDNIAIKGTCFANKQKSRIITTQIERKSILNIFQSLEEMNICETSYIDVDNEGFIKMEDLETQLKKKPLLFAIHHVNYEIGTIQDIEKIGKMCSENDVIFYVDATQSFMKLPIDVKKMNIDILSISADKIHGPKGVAALYVRDDLKMHRIFDGDDNKNVLRPGFTNIPGIMGFSKAIEIYNKHDNEKIEKMRDQLMKGLLSIEHTELNGPKGKKRVCNNVNVTFKYVEGESLLLYLGMKGIVATTGSACFSSFLKPSHVILMLGKKHEDAHGSLRLTLSRFNTEDDIEKTVRSVKDVVTRLREISPLG